MKSMRRSVLFLAFAGILALAGPNLSLAAFGVSPPFLNATHLVAGSSFTQTIYLVQDTPLTDVKINATLSVPDRIKSWITIDKGLSFVIPAGIQQFPVNVTVHVPQGESLGSYQGNIVFATAPDNTGQITIALGANVIINLTIGSGVFEQFSIPYIALPSIEEGWNPRATFRFQNDGNVPENLSGATFSLYDQYDKNQLAYLTKDGGFQEVPAFATKEYTVEFPTDLHLGVGDYWGVVTFYRNNEAIASQKAIFHVLPRGSLSSQLDIAFQNIMKYWVYYLIALLALVLIVRRIWMMRRERNRK
jgi:hypothetical protein